MSSLSGLFEFSIANNAARIAWSIAQGLHAPARNWRSLIERSVLNKSEGPHPVPCGQPKRYMCDVSKDANLIVVFANAEGEAGKLHALVHSVAYAPAEELKGILRDHYARRLSHRA